MSTANICILLTIIVYMCGMIAIGLYFTRQNRNTDDFYLGGRRLGPLVTAMSAEASDMSSYLLLGLPGVAYLSGLADVGWTVIGLAIGTYLNWLFTARRLRRYSHLTRSFTFPQFLSNRFRDEKHVLTFVAAAVILIFFVPYTGSGFAACGKLFHSLFGFDYFWAMVISALVIVAYTTAGGFMAASMTDFIQSIIMTTALVVILGFAVVYAGGFDAVTENARSLAGYFSMTETHVNDTGEAAPYNFLTIITTLSWGLGYFGMPHILLRFMAIENEYKLTLSRRVASVWVVIAMAIAVGIGVTGRALSANGAIVELFGNDSETVIIRIADLLSTFGLVPAILGGVVMSGILASTMSTASSQLLAASSSFSQNIMQETLKVKLSMESSMVAARLTVVVIAVLGMVIARNPDSSVFGIVSFAWAGFGASFGPTIICGLYWKRTTLQGAVAGMIAGGAMVFIWKFLIKPMGGIFGLYELLPAFLVGLAVIIIVSLLTKEPSEDIQKEFELACHSTEVIR